MERSATVIFAASVFLLLGMLIILFLGRKRSSWSRRGLTEDMKNFARANFEFVDRLVMEHSIRNVILYKFIDGYVEKTRPGTELSREEDRVFARAARTAIKTVLEHPPVISEEHGGRGRYESFEVAVDSWRRFRQGSA